MAQFLVMAKMVIHLVLILERRLATPLLMLLTRLQKSAALHMMDITPKTGTSSSSTVLRGWPTGETERSTRFGVR